MNVLFVGLGSIGKRNLDACQRVRPNYSYAALRHKVNTESNIVKNLFTFEEIKSFEPSLVWICTPTYLHYESLKKIIEFKPAVFVEKPLAHTLDDLQQIKKMVNNLGRPFFYGCILRQHPLIQKTKEILPNYGRVISYQITCGSYLPSWRVGQNYKESYSSMTGLGGGVSLDLIHEFDYAEYLFGKIKTLEGFKAKVSHLEIDSDDICLATSVHESGIVGQVHLNYFRQTPRRDFEIVSERGWIQGDLNSGVLLTSSGDEEVIDSTRDSIHDKQAEYVFKVVENNLASNWNIADVVDLNLKVINLRRLN